MASSKYPYLGLTIVQDPRVADLLIEVDRPLFTYVHTFVISDKKTTIVLGSGKETALDGTIASGPMANTDIYLTPPNATGCGLTKVANGAGPVCTAC